MWCADGAHGFRLGAAANRARGHRWLAAHAHGRNPLCAAAVVGRRGRSSPLAAGALFPPPSPPRLAVAWFAACAPCFVGFFCSVRLSRPNGCRQAVIQHRKNTRRKRRVFFRCLFIVAPLSSCCRLVLGGRGVAGGWWGGRKRPPTTSCTAAGGRYVNDC